MNTCKFDDDNETMEWKAKVIVKPLAFWNRDHIHTSNEARSFNVASKDLLFVFETNEFIILNAVIADIALLLFSTIRQAFNSIRLMRVRREQVFYSYIVHIIIVTIPETGVKRIKVRMNWNLNTQTWILAILEKRERERERFEMIEI